MYTGDPTGVCEQHVKTHIDIDGELLDEVFRLSGLSTKRAAVDAALREYAKHLKRRHTLELRGKVTWIGDLDEMRADRSRRRE